MKKKENIILPLQTEKRSFYYDKDKLEKTKEEIEEFLSLYGNYMNNRQMAEKFLGCQEIQANNSVEGYNDDVDIIKLVIADGYTKKVANERYKIIKNLHQGYQMILKGEEINKYNLKKLYDIISDGLLCDYDIKNMGKYYRNGVTKVYYSANLAKAPDEVVDKSLIDEYMDSLFKYINIDNSFDNMTDYYIKSQILHFYFVYVHPYFDINGRTSRTTAMWYLINNEAYPFIIFNRAIPFDRAKYIKVIRETKKFSNMSYFLNYMLTHVKIELEKEYIINSINSTIYDKLTDHEYQTLRYILSMNGLKSVKDFASFYNRFNDKKNYLELKKEAIEPLIDKDVINFIRYTKRSHDKKSNFIFELNPNRMDNDPKKIKRLKL